MDDPPEQPDWTAGSRRGFLAVVFPTVSLVGTFPMACPSVAERVGNPP
jgi:hypothetical protein